MGADAGTRSERRKRGQRIRLAVPVRVQGHAADGSPWTEMSTTDNAEYGGAAFRLRRPVLVGHVLLLSLPLPKTMRMYDLTTPSYLVHAIVRNTTPTDDGTTRVGVMFLGRHPPKGHAKDPGGRFFLPGDAAARSANTTTADERRKSPRYDVSVEVRVSREPPVTFGALEERTITKNLGLGGAMVLTTLPVTRGERVTVRDLEGVLDCRAEVEGVTIGADNIPRLNLRFLDPSAADAAREILRRNGIR